MDAADAGGAGGAGGAAPLLEGHWFLGSLPERRERPLQLFLDAHARLGERVRMRMGPFFTLLSLSSPEDVKHVLVDQAPRYHKGFNVRPLKTLLGEGLLTSDGDFWKRQRRLAQPAFHRERMGGFAAVMVDATERMLARWRSRPDASAPFDLSAEMMRLTLSIVSRALFSTDVSEDAQRVGEALTLLLEETNRRVLSLAPVPLAVPTRRNRAFRAALRTLDGVVLDIIARRRRGETRGDDLLSLLMDARDAESGEGMSDAQLRDEVMTLFLAGHETTANALTWAWYLLLQHPAEATRLAAGVDAALGGRAPAFEDYARLSGATRVLEEAMRLYPPAWALGREARVPDRIGGQEVPARPNFLVVTLPWVVHRNPRHWPEPERFDPDRFLPERVAARPRLAYIPFGAGQRMCIGQLFALVEGTLVLAMMARAFTFSLVPGQRVEPEPLVTLRPRYGLQVTATPRIPGG
jgi:cytochrome P450